MEKYQFVFFSGTICFTALHIREVRKEISRRVERGRVESVKHDIELQMVGHCDGIPVVLYSCYLYNDSFELIHGSIQGTKDYLQTTWEYYTMRNRRNRAAGKASDIPSNHLK